MYKILLNLKIKGKQLTINFHTITFIFLPLCEFHLVVEVLNHKGLTWRGKVTLMKLWENPQHIKKALNKMHGIADI